MSSVFVLFLLWQNSNKTRKKLRQIVDKMSLDCRQIVNKLSFFFVCSQGIITKEIFLQFLRKLLKNTGCIKLFFRVQCSSLRGMPSDLPQKQGSIGPIILICQQRQSSITHPQACISMKEWPCLFLNQRQLYALLSINHSTCDSGSPWK